MRMGYYAPFSPGVGSGLIDACIDLAMFFKTDPYVFFEKSPDEIGRLCEAVNRRTREIERE